MNTDLMDSTRRYARSTSEAFAGERAEWFEPPPKHAKVDRNVMVAAGLAFVFLMALLTWEKFV